MPNLVVNQGLHTLHVPVYTGERSPLCDFSDVVSCDNKCQNSFLIRCYSGDDLKWEHTASKRGRTH